MAAAPDDLALSLWGVVMEGRGYQIPHIHPAAWLSGVYYASVPDFIAARASGQAGWIEFGRPPDHFHNKAQPHTRAIPFQDSGIRVSIAFDLRAA